ncbi:hypothetical protein [Mycolicibacterium komossense]|uniref:Uncharacterized protein n=1 Tax=Mycolicibacterium komossense TaxID=1779 RepID=A0ABT3CMG9_9MYCO|nr:hypothetical protein [Mycolicibacterium komossense]MCV7230685.1 hypothetical protein [Mycolicibacterium komossense]
MSDQPDSTDDPALPAGAMIETLEQLWAMPVRTVIKEMFDPAAFPASAENGAVWERWHVDTWVRLDNGPHIPGRLPFLPALILWVPKTDAQPTLEVTIQPAHGWPGIDYGCNGVWVSTTENGERISLPTDCEQGAIDRDELDALIACLHAIRDAR